MKKILGMIMFVGVIGCGVPCENQYFLHNCSLINEALYSTVPTRSYSCMAENRDNETTSYTVYVMDHNPNTEYDIITTDFYLSCQPTDEENVYDCTSEDQDNERYDFTVSISTKEATTMNYYDETDDETLAEIAYGDKE